MSNVLPLVILIDLQFSTVDEGMSLLAAANTSLRSLGC